MIGYTDRVLSTPTRNINPFKQITSLEEVHRITSGQDSRVSLTPLWEFVVRTKSLPEGLDVDGVFEALHLKLKNPEKEVRQHALRVLVDLIQVIHPNIVDQKMEIVLNDLILNLGHIGPAVRKGAVDCMRVYLYYSLKSNDILKTIIHDGLENPRDKQNVVYGLILSLPFMIFPKIEEGTLSYVVRILTDKMSQLTHQEIALRSLIRVREIVGHDKFNKLLDPTSKKEFELLCGIYDLHLNLKPKNGEALLLIDSKSYWNDVNQNIINEKLKSVNEEIEDEAEIIQDKVILETEFKLRSGPAITMQIHEEIRKSTVKENFDSNDDVRRDVGIVKVLTDDSEQEYYEEAVKRSPRRVRFGGEIVKLRTPDSDSNQPSDADNDLVIKKKLEQRHQNNKNKLNSRNSLIPVLIKNENGYAQSVPNSPKRQPHKEKQISTSSPNLNIFGSKIYGSSRIPMRLNFEQRDKLKVIVRIPDDEATKSSTVSYVKTRKSASPLPPIAQALPNPKNEEDKNGVEDFESTHKSVEILYNLSRSPERPRTVGDGASVKSNQRRLSTADGVFYANKEKNDNITRNIKTADEIANKISNQVVDGNYNSFYVYDSNPSDSQIESFDCRNSSSSSGSEILYDNNWIHFGPLDYNIINDLKSKDDLKRKLHGLEEFTRVLKLFSSLVLQESQVTFLLQLLFSVERHSQLRNAGEEALKILFIKIETSLLYKNLNHVAINLSKIGAPLGVRLSAELMKKIPPRHLINQLLDDSVLRTKSSKVREGSLQIIMAISRTFPSTEINITQAVKAVSKILNDPKRRVRQAAIETIASLAQLSSTSAVIDIISSNLSHDPNKDHLLGVIRTRLSRRQLPFVDVNGNIRYSTPVGELEIEYLTGETDLPKRLLSNHHENKYMETNNKSNVDNAHNVWQANKRDLQPNEQCLERNESDTSRAYEVGNKDDQNDSTSGTQIWLLNPSPSLEPLVPLHGTLRPVYLIDRNVSRPPKHSVNSADAIRERNSEVEVQPQIKSPKKFVSAQESSRFINNFQGQSENDLKPHRYSSSTSSSNSGSSGSRTNWLKNSRTGIPVPVSCDSRLRFKSPHETGYSISGSRYPRFIREKSPPLQDLQEKLILSPPRTVLTRQPFSSGSDSSEFYTPPAETYHQEDFDAEPQRFISTPLQVSENFTVLDDDEDVCNNEPAFENLSVNGENDEVPSEQAKHDALSNSFDELDISGNARKFTDSRNLSKSEADLIKTPDLKRKAINSAPALNEIIDNVRFKNFDETPSNSTETSLPCSVAEFPIGHEVQTSVCPPKTGRKSSKTQRGRTSSKNEVVPFPKTLLPFSKPKEAVSEVLCQLESGNWENIIKGLQGLVRLTRHHQEILECNMHNICVALSKQIKNLRSQVARAACSAAAEMFTIHRKALEMDLEELASSLLHRSADTNKFLRSDANAALDSMCVSMPPLRIVSIVATRGGGHHNAAVRCTASRLLCVLTNRLGPEKVFQLPKETKDKLLVFGANMLTEGSLETRKHAKMMLGTLATHNQFQKAMMEAVPACTMRHISKTLRSLN